MVSLSSFPIATNVSLGSAPQAAFYAALAYPANADRRRVDVDLKLAEKAPIRHGHGVRPAEVELGGKIERQLVRALALDHRPVLGVDQLVQLEPLSSSSGESGKFRPMMRNTVLSFAAFGQVA